MSDAIRLMAVLSELGNAKAALDLYDRQVWDAETTLIQLRKTITKIDKAVRER